LLILSNNKNEEIYTKLENNIFIKPKIKSAHEKTIRKISEFDKLYEDSNGKEIQYFTIGIKNNFGAKYTATKTFITAIEKMLLEFYEGIVEHIKSCHKPTPKILKEDRSL